MNIRALPIFLALLLFAACSGKSPEPAPVADCPTVYVYAPGNYIIDIASGSEVVLDPEVRDFPLFCTPKEALAALKAELARGSLEEGDWRVYKMDGSMNELAQTSDSGGRMLGRMGQIIDWVEREGGVN
ncbi:MAG: SON protein [Desulfovibrio sp.]|jgi:hypothetical protein|nr:SON protein [Desulfovibrio sp.]